MKHCICTIIMVVFAGCARAGEQPFPDFTADWRDNPVWHDGQAEYAVYDATRIVYGKERTYEARLITNKELADPDTKTKSETDRGREVFKHHLREDVPTENYTYHYSTMVYVGVSDLKSLKIDMGSMEDCGASYKQFVNHAGELTWMQSTYFPGEGLRQGAYSPPTNLMYHDALTVALRGYPFDSPRDIAIRLLPDQTTSRWTATDPMPATIRYVGRENLDVPIGTVACHHVRVTVDNQPTAASDYWFAAENGPTWLHLLVQYQGYDGTRYRLRSVRRWDYWRH